MKGADLLMVEATRMKRMIADRGYDWQYLVDLVASTGTTFRYTATGPEGQLTGKKAYLAIASGGTPMGSDIDFMSRWLTFFLGFLGITDVEIVAADGIMGIDGEAKIAAARETAERLAA